VGEGEATVSVAAGADRAQQVTVRGERVDIDVAAMDAPTVASYVSALCPGSVPTVLWWSGLREASRPFFEALQPLANTLLIDSSGGTPDDTAIRRVAEFHAQQPEVVLHDLAWLRLAPWQDMIANFFDDPNLVRELFSIRRLHIVSGSDAEALYLGGWLASRLGWKASGPNSFTDLEGNIVQFTREREGTIRRVRSVCLDSAESSYHGALSDDPGVVRVWVEGRHARDARLFPLQSIDNASLLERGVLETDPDEIFETALLSVATLLG
jgi:glucose-6-phosphate dehydrogenase assembly protein OpcA